MIHGDFTCRFVKFSVHLRIWAKFGIIDFLRFSSGSDVAELKYIILTVSRDLDPWLLHVQKNQIYSNFRSSNKFSILRIYQ